MSSTCKFKTFDEYKALITFKFANKDSIIRKTALWKHNIRFLGKFPFRKGKVFCY